MNTKTLLRRIKHHDTIVKKLKVTKALDSMPFEKHCEECVNYNWCSLEQIYQCRKCDNSKSNWISNKTI